MAIGPLFSIVHLCAQLAVLLLVVFTVQLSNPQPTSSQLADPCEFPSPTDPAGFSPFSPSTFSAVCQLEYHQTAYLCDPSGMLSRTEAEILDRQLRFLLNGHNATGCVCPANGMVPQPMACTPSFKRRNNGFRLALALVPFSSIASVNLCLESKKHIARRSGQVEEDKSLADKSQAHTYQDAALAYGELLVDRWTRVKRKTASCEVDIFVVYVQQWVPSDWKHPFVVRIFRSRLKRLSHLNSVQSAARDVSPFETLLRELTKAIKLTQDTALEGEPGETEDLPDKHSDSQSSDDQTSRTKESQKSGLNSSSTMGGVPSWAYFVGFGLVALVLVTVYAASLVNRKLVNTQQQKKYTAINARSGGAGCGTGVGAANERWKAGLAAGGTNATGTILQGTGVVMNCGGPVPQAITKSSMMFRQFSGAGKRGTQKNGAHIQKI